MNVTSRWLLLLWVGCYYCVTLRPISDLHGRLLTHREAELALIVSASPPAPVPASDFTTNSATSEGEGWTTPDGKVNMDVENTRADGLPISVYWLDMAKQKNGKDGVTRRQERLVDTIREGETQRQLTYGGHSFAFRLERTGARKKWRVLCLLHMRVSCIFLVNIYRMRKVRLSGNHFSYDMRYMLKESYLLYTPHAHDRYKG